MKIVTVAALSLSLLASAPAFAQTAASGDWRTVAPENLLVIDTIHGRVLVELEPRIAPQAVNRIRTLANQGFYDGLKFHRVIPNFMAQTGDPEGTGQGGSDLPDLAGEFEFRRGRDAGFVPVEATPEGQLGLIGAVPVVSQPDAQMMITADFKAAAQGLFCPAVVGMARASSPDSANSQFFVMTGPKDDLNGRYTPFGRVVAGMDAVRAIKAGNEAENGKVENPDVMTRVRTASALPEGGRPTVRVATGAALRAEIERVRDARGAAFTVCDVQPPAEVVGG